MSSAENVVPGATLNAAHLPLDRCPHCGIAKPLIARQWGPAAVRGSRKVRHWAAYGCSSCAGVVLASAGGPNDPIRRLWPSVEVVAHEVPARARGYLQQAIDSKAAPDGAVMLAASSIDAMLKDKGLKAGTLNSRINEAASAHLITIEMAAWAHDVRLDANDQRHADDAAAPSTLEDAERVILFAQALAEFLYVLPARVARGRATAASPSPS